MAYKSSFQPSKRFRELAITTDGGEDPLIVKTRADLSFGEVQTLVFKVGDLIAAQWEKLAPFVVAWNVIGEDDQPIPPPCDDPENFGLIPSELFWTIWNEIKGHSSGEIDSKLLSEYVSTAVLANVTVSESA